MTWFALLAQVVTIDSHLATLESDWRVLTSFGVAARYPDDLFEPTEIDGREMVEAAQRVDSHLGKTSSIHIKRLQYCRLCEVTSHRHQFF